MGALAAVLGEVGAAAARIRIEPLGAKPVSPTARVATAIGPAAEAPWWLSVSRVTATPLASLWA